MQYDAILRKWYVLGDVMAGLIFEDKKQRFSDGYGVITSKILEFVFDENLKEGYVKTKNSVYKLENRWENNNG